MANLYITEFQAQGRDTHGDTMPAAQMPPIAQQTVAISGTSAQSAAINRGTTLVRICSDVACYIEVAADPTAAAATSMRMAADSPEYFSVPVGTLKIAGITG